MNINTTVLIDPQPSWSLNVPPPPPLFTAARPLSPTNTEEYSWVDREASHSQIIPPPPILSREKGILMPLETKIAIKAVDRIFTEVYTLAQSRGDLDFSSLIVLNQSHKHV